MIFIVQLVSPCPPSIFRGTVGPVDADPALLYAASDGKRKPGARAYGY